VLPLSGSDNPANQIAALQNVPQRHYVGSQDGIIPPVLVQQFAARFPQGRRPTVVVEANFDHQCCWAENRTRIYMEATGDPNTK
jgi:hypothetical protein